MISQIPRARPHLDRAKTSQSPAEHSSQGRAFCWRKGGVWDKQSRLCWKKTNVFVAPLVHIFPNIVRDLENSGCPCPGRETQSECCPVEPRGLCPVKTPSTTSPPWKGRSQVAWPREGASQVLGAEGCLLSPPCRGWTESSTTTSLLTPTPEPLKRKCSLRWNVFHLNSLQAVGFRRCLWEKKEKKSVTHSVMSASLQPRDCSPPGSYAHGILQARIWEWVVISFSRESSLPRDWIWVSCIAERFFMGLTHQWSPQYSWTTSQTVGSAGTGNKTWVKTTSGVTT